jgi:hypothetical protein
LVLGALTKVPADGKDEVILGCSLDDGDGRLQSKPRARRQFPTISRQFVVRLVGECCGRPDPLAIIARTEHGL